MMPPILIPFMGVCPDSDVWFLPWVSLSWLFVNFFFFFSPKTNAAQPIVNAIFSPPSSLFSFFHNIITNYISTHTHRIKSNRKVKIIKISKTPTTKKIPPLAPLYNQLNLSTRNHTRLAQWDTKWNHTCRYGRLWGLLLAAGHNTRSRW